MNGVGALIEQIIGASLGVLASQLGLRLPAFLPQFISICLLHHCLYP